MRFSGFAARSGTTLAAGFATLALLTAAPVHAEPFDMEVMLEPARTVALEDAQFWLLTEGGGGYANGGKLKPFRLTTHYDEGARVEGGQSVAWQDLYGGVDCTSREIYIGTTTRRTASGVMTGGDLPGDDVMPIQPNTLAAAVADGLCNGVYASEAIVPAQSYAGRVAFARYYFERRRSGGRQ